MYVLMFRPHISQVWDDHKSAKRNLSEMGLSYDPNITTRSSSKKACRKVSIFVDLSRLHYCAVSINLLIAGMFEQQRNFFFNDFFVFQETSEQKSNIATALEAEAKAPRVVKFKFPKTLSIYYSYLISKYGDNYKVRS